MSNSPIIVSSPAACSGATFIQRLISSSDNGICYGADAARRLLMLSEFTHSECLALQEHRDLQSFYLQNLLAGNQDFGVADLEIPGELPKHALVGALMFFKQHYDEATKAIEKEVWACKSPKSSFLSIVKAADFIPDLKCIYIYRNIVDVVRSQKSLGLISTEDQLIATCTEWINNTDVIAALSRKNFESVPAMLHPIKFEVFLADKDAAISQLEAFSGLKNIQREIADLKVNRHTPASDTDPTPVLSYEDPATLTDVELHIIAHLCQDRLTEIYPESPDLLQSSKMTIQ
ncbi:sulfotransferase [Labrenzia sp. PHM005]|uniref:sulfotransferase n=1 Tax=Labrenzia sp. PHM005 TaxID=2590016 RepID=UPI00143DF861|nr:sulfotransferase [Labrenzia sp. PHM005]